MAGYRTVSAALRGNAATLETRASQVVRKVALDTEAAAKNLAPVDTGNLRNSIVTKSAGTRATVIATASYAEYVENGTSAQSPQPFMQPAAEAMTPIFKQAIGRLAE